MKQEAARKKESTAKGILLDPDRKSPRSQEFEDKLSSWIVGQERAQDGPEGEVDGQAGVALGVALH